MSPTALMSPLRRDVFTEVPQTLSSWDSCMAKSYCKYPVIVGIVVGSLVLFACLWCMARCICCGAKCCCCGCGSKKKKPSKFADGPGPSPFHRGGAGGPAPTQGFQPSPAPPVYEAPQFATFDASGGGKVNDDALPPMPSWDNATTRRVEDTTAPTQDVELGRLDSTGQSYNGGGNGAVAPGKTGRGGYAEVPSNPGSPVPGSRPTPTPGSGYRGTEAGSYFSQSQGTTTAYDGAPPALGHDYGYGGTHTPAPSQNQNAYPYRATSPYDQRVASPSVYDNGSAYGGYGQGYGQSTKSPPPPQRIYSPEQSYGQTPQPYQTQQQQYPLQSGYRGYSPGLPTNSPPPPSNYQNNPYDMDYNRSGTPASMQAGRKPAPNTWRDV